MVATSEFDSEILQVDVQSLRMRMHVFLKDIMLESDSRRLVERCHGYLLHLLYQVTKLLDLEMGLSHVNALDRKNYTYHAMLYLSFPFERK